MNMNNLSEQASMANQFAFTYASDKGFQFVGSEHILWGLTQIDSTACKVLDLAGIDGILIDDIIHKYDQTPKKGVMVLNITKECDRIFELAEAQADKLHHKYIEPEHILLAMILENGSAASQLLLSTGVNIEIIREDIIKRMGKDWPLEIITNKEEMKTKVLDEFSIDLTAKARDGKLDPLIGRDKEVSRTIQILSRRTKNNPVLIGEPGVGKTAIVEGLASRIMEGDVPKNLLGKRLMMLDLSSLVSGTKFRGDFEERIKNYIEEAKQNSNIILFIDELHTLIGAGAAEGGLDAANILKTALGRGELQIIGATTNNEYQKHIEKDSALERRFQPITVEEPTVNDTIEMLQGLRFKYEKFHDLTFSDGAIKAAVELSEQYIADRFLPDKAIDVIDEAASHKKTNLLSVPVHLKDMSVKIQELSLQKKEAIQENDFLTASNIRDQQEELQHALSMKQEEWEEKQSRIISEEDIASTVSRWTGVPLTMMNQDERTRLRNLETILHQQVIGQDEAVHVVSKAIRRSRVGIRESNRPMGSFLFLGPTGVGKTEVCRALAKAMFQDESTIIRIYMSEYMERHTVSKLIGS
ncbi:MAG: AAA family ATPase, partial [Coprobacillaceae bacterium]